MIPLPEWIVIWSPATLDGVLLVIAGTTLVATALLEVRERVRDFGVLRTIGFTRTRSPRA